jgi:Fic family protein
MVFLRTRIVKDRPYRYLCKSVRLRDGHVRSIQKLVKEVGTADDLYGKYAEYFEDAQARLNLEQVLELYGIDSIYTKKQTAKVEAMRSGYNRLLEKLSPAQKKDVFDRFVANYTYDSNALEGNSLTLKDVSMVLFERKAADGKDLREIYETRNTRKVMDKVLDGCFHVREKDIIRIHALFMDDIDERRGYKILPNYLLGRDIELTPPENVPDEMRKLIAWYDDSVKKTHPLKLSTQFHGRFLAIHPFEDGNGRVGRFLTNVILIENGYPPLIIRKTQRASYLKCLADYDRGYAANLERLFLEKYKRTYEDFFGVYIKYLK